MPTNTSAAQIGMVALTVLLEEARTTVALLEEVRTAVALLEEAQTTWAADGSVESAAFTGGVTLSPDSIPRRRKTQLLAVQLRTIDSRPHASCLLQTSVIDGVAPPSICSVLQLLVNDDGASPSPNP